MRWKQIEGRRTLARWDPPPGLSAGWTASAASVTEIVRCGGR